jgi:hypothetical protein
MQARNVEMGRRAPFGWDEILATPRDLVQITRLAADKKRRDVERLHERAESAGGIAAGRCPDAS